MEKYKINIFQRNVNKIREKYPNLKVLENAPNDTSKAYKIPSFKGQIGFITSMTEHFCGSCNRLRLMADGSLKVCLFGNTEISLRDALRQGCNEKDLVTMISAAVKRKKEKHAESYFEKFYHFNYMSSNPNIVKIPFQASYFPSKTMNELLNPPRLKFSNVRAYSKLTHVTETGSVNMVDVGSKPISKRTARAEATVHITSEISSLLRKNLIKKGDVLSIAQIAGIMGAKRTHELIPLCHSIALSKVDVQATLCDITNRVLITSSVVTHDRTGVEMEALVGVMVAAVTVYDMCKAVSKGIEITDVRLIHKSGGTKGDYTR